MMVRAKHRCEVDIGSDSDAERKNSFFAAPHGALPEHGIPVVCPMMQMTTRPMFPTRARARGLAIALIATVLLAAGCATAPQGGVPVTPLAPARLDPSRPVHVAIDCPITHPWIWSDQIAESFYSRVVDGFRKAGYKGNIVYVSPGFAPPEGSQAISISIYRWRVNRDRSVEAVINADYDGGGGVKQPVGTFSGLSMHYFSSEGRLALERAFDESAVNAAQLLLQRLSPGS